MYATQVECRFGGNSAFQEQSANMTQELSYSSSFGGYGNYPGQGEVGNHGGIQIKGSIAKYN